jgi:hypothetical protein
MACALMTIVSLVCLILKYDKYRALVMAIGQSNLDNKTNVQCPTADNKNSLGWTNCTVVPGCEETHDNLQKAWSGKGVHQTHIDMSKISSQDLTCLNYLVYTAITHARSVCTNVSTKVPPSRVPIIQKTGTQQPIPSHYKNGAPESWWGSEAAQYCPTGSACLPGPKLRLQPNPQVQFVNEDGGGDDFERELHYNNHTKYTGSSCLFGAKGVSVYDIAQIWMATFPKSSIDTCAAALISTQGECITGQLKPTPDADGRQYPGVDIVVHCTHCIYTAHSMHCTQYVLHTVCTKCKAFYTP